MSPSLGLPDGVQISESSSALSGSTSRSGQHSRQAAKMCAVLELFNASLGPALPLLCWTVCSSALIILNKELMVTDGFKFPMALTAAGQLTSYLGGEALQNTLTVICCIQATPQSCEGLYLMSWCFIQAWL